MKPGYKTTEFWISLLAAIVPVVGPVAQQVGPQTSAWVGAIAAAGYALSRGLAKQSTPPGP